MSARLAILVVLLLQAPASQDASFAEKAKAARENVGKSGAVPNSPASLAEAAAAARKRRAADQEKAPRVYTNDDIATREPEAIRARLLQGNWYHGRALGLWCQFDRVQAIIDTEPLRKGAKERLAQNPTYLQQTNEIAERIPDLKKRAEYLKDRLTYTPKPVPDTTGIPKELDDLHNQCVKDTSCQMDWLDVTAAERAAGKCYQNEKNVLVGQIVTSPAPVRPLGKSGLGKGAGNRAGTGKVARQP